MTSCQGPHPVSHSQKYPDFTDSPVDMLIYRDERVSQQLGLYIINNQDCNRIQYTLHRACSAEGITSEIIKTRSQWYATSSVCGCRRWPPEMKGGCAYID
jgi:hypothetical protein